MDMKEIAIAPRDLVAITDALRTERLKAPGDCVLVLSQDAWTRAPESARARFRSVATSTPHLSPRGNGTAWGLLALPVDRGFHRDPRAIWIAVARDPQVRMPLSAALFTHSDPTWP